SEARTVRLECGPVPLPSDKSKSKSKSESNPDSKTKANPTNTSGPTVDDIAQMTVTQAYAWIGDVAFTGRDAEISRDIVPEIRERLKFLEEVGLGYLQLGRAVPT